MNDTCAVCVCTNREQCNKGVELEDRYLPKVRKGRRGLVWNIRFETSLGLYFKIHTQNAKFCSNSKSWAWKCFETSLLIGMVVGVLLRRLRSYSPDNMNESCSGMPRGQLGWWFWHWWIRVCGAFPGVPGARQYCCSPVCSSIWLIACVVGVGIVSLRGEKYCP